MTISFPTQTSRTKKPYSKQFLSSFRIKEKDLIFVVGGIGMAIYLAITDLALLATILASFAVAGSLYFISACLPLVSKKLNFRWFSVLKNSFKSFISVKVIVGFFSFTNFIAV